MHGLDFCMGCWSEMGPEGVLDAVDHFGSRKQIVYVHFRDVQGQVPCFNECFIDEGNLEPFEVVRALYNVGFDGFMITDHVPHMVDDTSWGHRGRAYAIGYIRALIDVVNARRGTGGKARLPQVTVAGKTGTAQVVALEKEKDRADESGIPAHFRDHAWFVAVAPAEDPRIGETNMSIN